MANPNPVVAAASAGGTLNEQISAMAAAGPRRALQDGALQRIGLDLIGPHPDQPRTTLDEARLKELMNGIVQSGGLLQPVTVRPALQEEARPGEPPYEYRLVAGQRRLEAYRRLLAAAGTGADRERYGTIPAIVVLGRDEADALRDAIIENVHRDDLLPLDAAEALASLKKKQNLRNAREVAQAVGMKEDRVKRLLRLNDSPEVVKDALRRGLTVTIREEPADGTGEGEGTPAVAREKRETLRRLDLMEALEFAQLYDHYFEKHGGFRKESAPARASGIVRNAIERAVQEGWGFRRIQDYVEAVKAGRERAEGGPAPRSQPLFKSDAKQVVIYSQRLEGASPEERSALATRLRELLAQVA